MIVVENLAFTYPGSEQPAVCGLSFTIEDGEIFGFLGPSGAGKSTTQKIIIGILKRYEGKIRVFDTDLSGHDNRYFERVGVSFELPNVYTKLTGKENLAFFRSLYAGATEDPLQLLEMVGLKDAANQPVSQFSKGMKMRLNFCRAFLNKPDLLFLDEPTSGQDPANAQRIKEIILDQKNKGRTVFLTTHDMVAAREVCDRVAFIVDGQINVIDTPRRLMIEHGRRVVRVEYRANGQIVVQDFVLEGIGENEAFLRLLKEEAIETIHTQEASLADIFIEVTGRSLA